MYKKDLALHNLQWLTCQKTKSKKLPLPGTKCMHVFIICLFLCVCVSTDFYVVSGVHLYVHILSLNLRENIKMQNIW